MTHFFLSAGNLNALCKDAINAITASIEGQTPKSSMDFSEDPEFEQYFLKQDLRLVRSINGALDLATFYGCTDKVAVSLDDMKVLRKHVHV